EIIIDAISKKPYLGHGTGALASDFIGTDQSAHNLYLEITLQIGVIGVLLFALFLYNIWKLFWLNKSDKVVALSASFFIGIIMHQVNEVLLIKNAVPINLLLWLAIGIGLSYCFNKTPDKK